MNASRPPLSAVYFRVSEIFTLSCPAGGGCNPLIDNGTLRWARIVLNFWLWRDNRLNGRFPQSLKERIQAHRRIHMNRNFRIVTTSPELSF